VRARTVARTAVLALAVLAGMGGTAAPQTPPTEYEVKAAFLYNFMRFVEWPPHGAPRLGSPFVVGVLGDDPFGPVLDQAMFGAAVSGHRVVVRRWASLEEVSRAQILFVGGSEDHDLPRIVSAMRRAGTLTVADTPGFADRGIAINFKVEEQKVRFEINRHSAEEAGLRLSSQLLKLARIVGPES
jgi:hypothetical protein